MNIVMREVLQMTKFADRLRDKDCDVIADSAEQKSIREIYNYGIKK